MEGTATGMDGRVARLERLEEGASGNTVQYLINICGAQDVPRDAHNHPPSEAAGASLSKVPCEKREAEVEH